MIKIGFKDSDMYDILNYKLDKNAVGNEYFSNLYPDAKWTSPNTIKTLLNSQIQVYLSMWIKIIDLFLNGLYKKTWGVLSKREESWKRSNYYGNLQISFFRIFYKWCINF